MTLTASAVVQRRLHLTASDPRLHETTLSRDMSHSGTGRYGQNEFINERFSPIPSFSLCLLPCDFSFMQAEQSDRFHIDWQRKIYSLLF